MMSVIGALRVMLGVDTAAFTDGLANANKSLKRAGKQMGNAGRTLSVAVSAPLAGLGTLAVRAGADFEAAMNRIGAATGANAGTMAELSDMAREMGRTTQFSATEAADAIEILAKNGLSTADIMGGALSASLQLAASSGSDLAAAGDLATDVMLNFGKSAADLGSVADGVAGVLLASKFGIDDYRLALAQAGGVAGGLGVELNEFNAVIAATSAKFASGSDAGTSFKTFLLRLVPQSGAAADAMEELGLSFFDSEGAMKSMADIAGELKQGFAGLNEEAKTDALTKLFGTDAMRTAIGLMDQGAEGIRALDAAIGEASASDQAAARMAGFSGSMKKLQSAFEGLLLAVSDSGLLDMVTGFVDRMTDMANSLSQVNPDILQFSTVLAGAAVVVGPLLVALGLMATAVAAVGIPVAAVIVGITALTAAAVAFWPEIVAAKDALIGFVTDGLARVQAMPGEILAFFEALPAQMAEIGRNIIEGLWSGISEAWDGVKAKVGDIAGGVADRFRSVLGIKSPSRVFREIGVNIMQGLQGGLDSETGGITDGMNQFASNLSGIFKGVLFEGMSLREGLSNILGSAADGFMDAAVSGITGAIFPGYAKGTNFAPGGWSVVGEEGAELVDLPRGSRVTSNGDLGDMLSGGGGGGEMAVRVYLDDDLNLQATVQQISDGAVARAAPGIQAAAVSQVRKGARGSKGYLNP